MKCIFSASGSYGITATPTILEIDAMAYRIMENWTARSLIKMATLSAALGLATSANAGVEISVSDDKSTPNSFWCEDTTVVFTGCAVTSGTVMDFTTAVLTPSSATGFLGDGNTLEKEIEATARELGDWRALTIRASGQVGEGSLNSLRFEGESSGTASLTVMLTQFDLVAGGDSLDLMQAIDFSALGSDLTGSAAAANVDFALYADTDNTKFGISGTNSSLVYSSTGITGSLGVTASPSGLASLISGGTYSLTQVFTINHFPGGDTNGFRETSFRSDTIPVPEPGIIGLLGLGLVLTALRRRRA